MRFLIALFTCLLASAAVAKPSPYRSVDAFSGDRWLYAQGGTSAADINRTMRCAPPHCARVKRKKAPRHESAAKVHRSGAVVVPLPRVRPPVPAMDAEQEAAYRVIAQLLADLKICVGSAPPPCPQLAPRVIQGARQQHKGLLQGLADEFDRALNGATADERKKLALIVKYESGGRNVMNHVGRARRISPKARYGYTAQGYYQMLNSNWRRLAPRLGIRVPNAMAASFHDQSRVALALLRERPGGGIGHWVRFNRPLRVALAGKDRRKRYARHHRRQHYAKAG